MKRVSPAVYDNLPPKLRLVACIEALARGDEEERELLIRSCPKFTYTQPDTRFMDTLESLMGLAISVEADLKEFLLRFYVSIRIEAGLSRKCLQDFADHREAWHMTLNAMGIDKETMALAGPPSSPVFELFEDLLPSPEAKQAEAISAEMLKCLRQYSISLEAGE